MLLDLATEIQHQYPCIFLSLFPPHPNARTIERSGFSNFFLFRSDGKVNARVRSWIERNPPACCIASDYSLFNLQSERRSLQPGIQFLQQLSDQASIPSALLDIGGLSLLSKALLQTVFRFVIIPISQYASVYRQKSAFKPHIRLWSYQPPLASYLCGPRSRFQRDRPTLFLSHRDVKDPLAPLWGKSLERMMKEYPQRPNVISFQGMRKLFSSPKDFLFLRNDSTVAEVNAWLAKTDLVVTSNPFSLLAARSLWFGARVAITFNNLAHRAKTQSHWKSLQRLLLRRVGINAAEWSPKDFVRFSQWLPSTPANFGPGLDISPGTFLLQGKMVPLFGSKPLDHLLQPKSKTTPSLSKGFAHTHSAIALIQDLLQ